MAIAVVWAVVVDQIARYPAQNVIEPGDEQSYKQDIMPPV